MLAQRRLRPRTWLIRRRLLQLLVPALLVPWPVLLGLLQLRLWALHLVPVMVVAPRLGVTVPVLRVARLHRVPRCVVPRVRRVLQARLQVLPVLLVLQWRMPLALAPLPALLVIPLVLLVLRVALALRRVRVRRLVLPHRLVLRRRPRLPRRSLVSWLGPRALKRCPGIDVGFPRRHRWWCGLRMLDHEAV